MALHPLKPCPFCGSQDIRRADNILTDKDCPNITGPTEYYFFCNQCHASSKRCPAPEASLLFWNERTKVPKPRLDWLDYLFFATYIILASFILWQVLDAVRPMISFH